MFPESSVSVTYASTLAVTLEQAKQHLRVIGSAEDSIITLYLTAAQRYVEEWCQICLIGGVIVQDFKTGWPSEYLSLSVGNVSGITSLSYNTIEDRDFTTVSSDVYIADQKYNRARIMLYSEWPDASPLFIRVSYTSGFSSVDAIPANIKIAILLVLADMYENRQDNIKTMPTAAQHLLEPYRAIQKI